MPELIFPPALVMILGAAIVAVAPRKVGQAVALIAPLVTLLIIWQIPDGVQLKIGRAHV